MKNLAEFKRVLQSCITHNLEMKSTVIKDNGEIVKANDFAPVCHIQSNAFALKRNEKLSWAEFRKASDWTFSNGTATQKMQLGKIVFELKTPEFFGL